MPLVPSLISAQPTSRVGWAPHSWPPPEGQAHQGSPPFTRGPHPTRLPPPFGPLPPGAPPGLHQAGSAIQCIRAPTWSGLSLVPVPCHGTVSSSCSHLAWLPFPPIKGFPRLFHLLYPLALQQPSPTGSSRHPPTASASRPPCGFWMSDDKQLEV
jgi:hypothetical protein